MSLLAIAADIARDLASRAWDRIWFGPRFHMPRSPAHCPTCLVVATDGERCACPKTSAAAYPPRRVATSRRSDDVGESGTYSSEVIACPMCQCRLAGDRRSHLPPYLRLCDVCAGAQAVRAAQAVRVDDGCPVDDSHVETDFDKPVPEWARGAKRDACGPACRCGIDRGCPAWSASRA